MPKCAVDKPGQAPPLQLKGVAVLGELIKVSAVQLGISMEPGGG